ncbi:DUF262 domain-containing protein [Helicobacter pylori]|uniref:DUF262 domain-containing protein n=1 Tax=Helicobacter pylori HP260AFii TaxID=1159077 RepID=A0ABC9SBB6_HELPX|nr:DUF262 domain-containing protein [Helicobacter pylori]EMH20850.1 hypothetical protein HMPREF1416_00422 [Helicobacter pylori GAM260ASi]EMH28827.1 hypothetical protein HMPREF1422_01126 [Helicobacter pylori GAM268Bii]EMH65375.1 hypothetical protein HMPREF1448_00098 [Helicobacter pylori HP260AFi]EMH67356.1 hypothetical protein HMPREF1450_00821 [Helicobacter pylori HP260ASii]EMH68551.1 hypothetical protein HMPREF1449_00233 [Helicobacter pylori HP260AFii]
MAKIESNDLNLRDILKDELYYQIPIYQRPYQWTEENCEKLLDDLFFNYEDDRESDYFCGSLVLILISEDPKKAKTYDIVDGQQRLSTFILLAKVLATLYSERLTEESKDYLQESLITKYGKKDRLNFNAMGFNSKKDFQYALTSFNDVPVSNAKNNYLKNAICLKNYLKKKEIEDINDFIEWLYFKVVFITITCPDADKALRIFNVLNARGLALNATDIFKGELLKHAKEHERKEFVSRWNDLSQKCSDNDLKIETLFSWYLTYLNPVTSKEKTDKRLVTWFNKLNKTPLEYLKSVEDFYNAYGEVLEMQDRHAYLLSYKDDDHLHVILCTSILHHYSDQDIEALKELLVKFYYQHWVAGRTKSKIEQTCCNIINALKEKKSIENIASIVKKYLDNNNVTQHFKENLEDDHLYTKFYFINGKTAKKNSWVKPILILVNYFMSDNANPAYIKMDDDLHVERILPQNPDLSSQWVKDFSEEERELYTHSLANLTLLGGKKNTKALNQALNQDFKEKKEIYMGNAVKLGKDKRGREKPFKVMTCYKMTIDVAQYAEWTPKSLEKRKEELIQKIESVLAL